MPDGVAAVVAGGDGLVLRRWSSADVEQLVAVWQDPDLTDRFPVDVPFTVASARQFVAAATATWEAGAAFHLCIAAADDPATVLGGCDISEALWAGPLDVGYWLARAARGRGVATAAVTILLGWAAGRFPGRPFALQVEPDNAASMAVAGRLGFAPDGGERTDRVRGRPRTLLHYGRVGPAR